MRQIIALCKLELKRTFKKPSSYVFMFVIPLLFAFLFGSLFNRESVNNIEIAIVAYDDVIFVQQMINQLQSQSDKQIRWTLRSQQEAEALLEKTEIQGVIKVVANGFPFGEQAKPVVQFDYVPSLTIAPLIQQQIDQTIQSIRLQAVVAQVGHEWLGKSVNEIFHQLQKKQEPVAYTKISNSSQSKPEITSMSYSTIGFSLMFVMLMMLAATSVLLEARQLGVWDRLLVTPTSHFQLLCGYFLSFFVIGIVQFFCLMLLSSVLFDVQWGDSIGVSIVMITFLACVIALSIAVTRFAKTAAQQNAIGTVVIVTTCMLGGVFWPLSIVSEPMQKIAQFVPQSWAIEAFTILQNEGGTIGDLTTQLLILLLFTIVFSSVAFWNRWLQ